MQVHNPATSDLKCPTCVTNFESAQQHKEHYKTDFHRYNLKRKMVKLAPATLEQFKAKKVDAHPEEDVEFKCNECGKKFNSVKTFNQHIETKKHNPNAVRTDERPQASNKTSAPFKKNKNVCLYCRAEAANFSQNLRHMQSAHSFFIPETNYCTDQQGLIEYLQQKIEIGFMCITCENKNAKDFNSGEAVRKHMNDKGHSFMKTEQGYDEYLKFYDFSSQFKEILESQKDRYVPGIEYTTLKVVVKDGGQNQDQDDGEWEDDSDEEEDNQPQIKQKDQNEEEWESEGEEQEIKEKGQEKKKNKVKTYQVMRPTTTSNGELLLPNGKILGHRKFRYLYKQTYRSTFWLNQDIKALGYEFANNALVTRERLIELARHDKLLYRYKNRWEKKLLRNGMQNNMQKYFRTSNSL